MNTFDQANEALSHDLVAYARALRMIVSDVPRARELCERVIKETRLAQALLAFASGPDVAELQQVLFTLANLWPYRERRYASTLGFEEEIAEAHSRREDALRVVRGLRRRSDPLASELTTCFENIGDYLEEQAQLLAECHAAIHPHAENMAMTRKRLDLLIAAIDARLPPSRETEIMLAAYSEAAATLQSWETGVPLDEQGIDILENCLELLGRAGVVFPTSLNPGRAVS